MEILSIISLILSLALIGFLVKIELQLRTTKRILAETQEQITAINRIVPWLAIQRNVLCQNLWGTGLRGVAQHIHPPFGPDDSDTTVTIAVTSSAVTISALDQEEFVMRMNLLRIDLPEA